MTDMNKALKRAALLRNLIETCLRAAPDPMSGRDLSDWLVANNHIGTSLADYSRLSTQLRNMASKGAVEQIGHGIATTYHWVGAKVAAPEPTMTQLPELKLRVNKSNNTLTLQFNGLAITIEVTG